MQGKKLREAAFFCVPRETNWLVRVRFPFRAWVSDNKQYQKRHNVIN
jgi:hypothetical protein